jgi:hypothetical protein
VALIGRSSGRRARGPSFSLTESTFVADGARSDRARPRM